MSGLIPEYLEIDHRISFTASAMAVIIVLLLVLGAMVVAKLL